MGILETSLRSLHYARQLRSAQQFAKFDPFIKCARRPSAAGPANPRPARRGPQRAPPLRGAAPARVSRGGSAVFGGTRLSRNDTRSFPRACREWMQRVLAAAEEGLDCTLDLLESAAAVLQARRRAFRGGRPAAPPLAPPPPASDARWSVRRSAPRPAPRQERAQVLLSKGKLAEAAALHAGPLLSVVARIESIPMRLVSRLPSVARSRAPPRPARAASLSARGALTLRSLSHPGPPPGGDPGSRAPCSRPRRRSFSRT